MESCPTVAGSGRAERRRESLEVNGELFLTEYLLTLFSVLINSVCVVHTALEDSWQAIFLSPF